MELHGKCRILRIHRDEKHRWQKQTLYHAIVERCVKEGLVGATVLRGIEGYGSSARIHSARWIEAADSLPVVVEIIDQKEKVDSALRWLSDMLPQHCLVTLTDTHVAHYFAPRGKARAPGIRVLRTTFRKRGGGNRPLFLFHSTFGVYNAPSLGRYLLFSGGCCEKGHRHRFGWNQYRGRRRG